MNIQILIISLLSLIFYSGCTHHNIQKTELTILNQKVQELNSHDKQLIYKSIQNEINRYSEKGNEAFEAGYNSDALAAYELVNFYEGYARVSKKKIDGIKKSIRVKSKKHYFQALKYSVKDKKRALAEFNIVLMNDPTYKDTIAQVKRLKTNRDIKILISSLESSLQTKSINNRGTLSNLKAISSDLKKLLKYDYKNEIAIKAKVTLKGHHQKTLQYTVGLYKEGDIDRAKKRFQIILSIYNRDATSTKYLKKIEIKKSKQLNLNLAQNALVSEKYKLSIEHAKKVLEIDSQNDKAKNIITIAKRESTKKVANLIDRGKQYYNNKNLDKARQSFQKVLSIDPHNNTSLIYAKRIEGQLKTIKSLQ